MRHVCKLSPFALLLAFSGAGTAQAFEHRTPEFPPREYTCRLDGQDVHLGESRCLRTPQGSHLAECGIVLNVSTWRGGETACL